MIARPLKRWLKERLRRARSAYVRRFQAFDAAAFKAALGGLGIGPGAVLFVHSAFDRFEGFTGRPKDVIAALLELVGPAGTVLMPSMPFTGTAVEYALAGKATDIRRTPSQMGIISEVFRRQPATIRSFHPTHPVLAQGAAAAALTAGHEMADTPCGAGSPFAKLADADAKIVFLGTGIEAMTYFHYLEEAYEQRLPLCPFTAERFAMRVVDGERIASVTLRLYDPQQSRKRRIARMIPGLKARGAYRQARLGFLNVLVIPVRAAAEVFHEMIERGDALYDT